MKVGTTFGVNALAVLGSLFALAAASSPACGGVVVLGDPATDSPTSPSATGGALTTLSATTAIPTNAAVTNTAVTNRAVNVPTNTVVNVPANRATNVATNVVTNVATNVVTNVAANVPTNVAANVPTNAGLSGSYLDDGTIHGYCFGISVVGGVVTECDMTRGLVCPYLLPGTSWDDIAMIGCNVNQPVEGGQGSEGTWLPTDTREVCVYGSGFERIQIQGPEGASNANDRWCAPVPPGGGCVEWIGFNTQCWDYTGAFYAGQPLQVVGALQPSKSDGVDVRVTPISDTLVVSALYVQP